MQGMIIMITQSHTCVTIYLNRAKFKSKQTDAKGKWQGFHDSTHTLLLDGEG